MRASEENIFAHKPNIDKAIEKFCKEIQRNLRNDYSEDVARVFNSLLMVLGRGGKRMRGCLTIYSYELFGGKNDSVALQAAVIVEILQTYLLVVDDIVDRSDERRGGPSAHRILEKSHYKMKSRGNAEHYGTSQAISAGLMAQNLAFSLIDKLPVPANIKTNAYTLINHSLLLTGIGQTIDVELESNSNLPDEQSIIKMMRLKTSYYSFNMPLHLGAILAGANDNDSAFLEKYSENAGVAFQLNDDLVSTMNDFDKSGKNPRDDLSDGKLTVLVTYTLRNGKSNHVKVVRETLGNRNITDEQLTNARQALIDSGSVHHSRELITKYSNDAINSLSVAPNMMQEGLEPLRKVLPFLRQF